MTGARVLIAGWSKKYNQGRPHSSLDYKPPAPEAKILETLTLLVVSLLGGRSEELGQFASISTNTFKMSSTYTVFAQTEIISLLAAGESKENIIAGLHASIASQVGSMAKRLGFRSVVMMTGGVAKNIGAREALERELNTEIMVPNGIDHQLVGALGAALIAEEIVKGKTGS